MKVGDIIYGGKLGEIKLIAGPYSSMAKMYEQVIDKTKVPGYHSHECLSCGTKWIHGDENAGNQTEHTCPTCGKTMPLTLGSVQLPDGTLSWRYGWAKAGVIMANGQEQRVPVQVQQQPSQLLLHIKFYLTIVVVSAMVATGVFYGMRWIEEQEKAK